MKYHNIVKGTFLSRPNRFIAYVEIDGRTEKVHVKNTGRCKELLTERATVYLEKSDNNNRSTAYDLIAVEKGGHMVNMDSQAPNKVVEEWLLTKDYFPDLILVRPETKYGNSRLDFYMENGKQKIFMEVKGVTLENNGVVSFPDAPSIRALKHVEELICAVGEGYEAYIMFVIQMEGVNYFTPNLEAQEEFAYALARAKDAGVHIMAYDCKVTSDSLLLNRPVPVSLESPKIKLRKGELACIPEPLLQWYVAHRRILPWREDPKPYYVWLSEIMLQQTRVEAVKPYFERFRNALPDIESLAKAPEDVLLKLWEGLGYYNRVRNLQKAAIQIMKQYHGEMPERYEDLLELKGIGSYTAGAIASIAFGGIVPAVDGNVLRVVSRIREDGSDILDARIKRRVEEELLKIIPKKHPGDFNQAMMEIGAMVCIPNGAPLCEECPLQPICLCAEHGTWKEYPVKKAKKARTIEEKTILVIQDEKRTALHKRPATGLLAGMYEFPTLEGSKTAEEVTEYLAQMGLKINGIVPLEDSKHIFSHKEWHMCGYMVRVGESAEQEVSVKKEKWIFAEQAKAQKDYSIPSAYAAYTGYLNIKLGNDKFK